MKRIIHATVREADDALHIECRFSDGQKYAPIKVDKEEESLAHWIASLLIVRQPEY